MKKILMFIVAIVLVAPTVASAKSYEIKDFNLNVEIPDSWVVFTRDNLEGNTDLAKFSLQKDSYLESMKTQKIYMDAISEDMVEVFVRINPEEVEMNNLSNYSDEDVKLFAKTLFEGNDYSIVKYDDITYVTSESYDSESEVSIIDYGTVVNGYYYNFSVQVYDTKVSDEISNEFAGIVKNAKFTLDPNKTTEKDDASLLDVVIGLAVIGLAIGGLVGIMYTLTKFFTRKKLKV